MQSSSAGNQVPHWVWDLFSDKSGKEDEHLGKMDALKGDAMLLRRGGLCKKLQQGVAVIKVHVLLDAILLAEGQEHIGTTP